MHSLQLRTLHLRLQLHPHHLPLQRLVGITRATQPRSGHSPDGALLLNAEGFYNIEPMLTALTVQVIHFD